jgi:TRAP-type C4-dicarboxylate transport system permease small subunit
MEFLRALLTYIPRSRKFWHSVATQSIAGLILLAAGILAANFTGLITDVQTMSTFALGLLGFIMVALFVFLWLSWRKYSGWVASTMKGRKGLLGRLLWVVYMAGPIAAAVGFFIFYNTMVQFMTANNTAHPRATLVVYSAKVPVISPLKSQSGENCYQSIVLLSNQTSESILFLAANGSTLGTNPLVEGGFVDAQDLTWVPIGDPEGKSVTGPLLLAPAHAAIVRLSSTKLDMLDSLRVTPASPLVALRDGGGASLTPSMVRSVDALGPISCHDPASFEGNPPDDLDLYHRMYPTPPVDHPAVSK